MREYEESEVNTKPKISLSDSIDAWRNNTGEYIYKITLHKSNSYYREVEFHINVRTTTRRKWRRLHKAKKYEKRRFFGKIPGELDKNLKEEFENHTDCLAALAYFQDLVDAVRASNKLEKEGEIRTVWFERKL